MPVTTRAKSRLQTVEMQLIPLARKPSKAIRQPSENTRSATFKQSSKCKEIQSPLQSLPPASSDKTLSRASNYSSPDRVGGERNSRQILAKAPSPGLPGTIEKYFWPCQECSCQEGAFEGLVDSCVACGHTMDDHEPNQDNPWTPDCEYLCKREKLVAEVLEHTRKYGVMVIRATPMVGKTYLLHLLGLHITDNERDLEPVYLTWKPSDSRTGEHYRDYLAHEREQWLRWNAQIRPHNPEARTIYLIDEAQGSYGDIDFWSMLKNHHSTTGNSLFVLVCVYGAAGVSHIREPNVESQAQRMHALQRVELRPSTCFSLCMLFRQDEVALIVKKFAVRNECELGEGIARYLYEATDGHPGMVGLLLTHILDLAKAVSLAHVGVYVYLTFSRARFRYLKY